MALRELLHYFILGLIITIPLILVITIALMIDHIWISGFAVAMLVVAALMGATLVFGLAIETLKSGQS